MLLSVYVCMCMSVNVCVRVCTFVSSGSAIAASERCLLTLNIVVVFVTASLSLTCYNDVYSTVWTCGLVWACLL